MNIRFFIRCALAGAWIVFAIAFPENTTLAAPTATTRYVSPTGSDTLIVNGGIVKPNLKCSANKPCKTLKWTAETVAADGDTIIIAAGTYVENVTLKRNLIIKGAGVRSTFLDGGAAGSVLIVEWNKTVTLTGVHISNGKAAQGGGIRVSGKLTLKNATLSNNQANSGGGINNYGTLVTKRVSFYNNQGTNNTGGGLANFGTAKLNQTNFLSNTSTMGAAIYNSSGTVTLNNSAIHGNTARNGYPGIYNSLGTLALTNVTISGNSSDSTIFQGGAIYQSGGSTSLNYVTITKNTQGFFGGVYTQMGSVIISHSIVHGNGANPQCGAGGIGQFSDGGYNVYADQSCGFFNGSGSILTNPKLKPLFYNGGFTPTHALKAASAAIDLIPANKCVALDQRGVTRPKDGNGDAVAKCDAGAFEYP